MRSRIVTTNGADAHRYGRAHAFTLSRIFGEDLRAPAWQREHLRHTRQMVAGLLTAPA